MNTCLGKFKVAQRLTFEQRTTRFMHIEHGHFMYPETIYTKTVKVYSKTVRRQNADHYETVFFIEHLDRQVAVRPSKLDGIDFEFYHVKDRTSISNWKAEQVNVTGWKLLSPSCATHGGGTPSDGYYPYPTPNPGQKWSEWMVHPDKNVRADGKSCGPGGWHVMITQGPDSRYAQMSWWPWFAEVKDILGSDDNKARGRAIRLRRITPRVFWRIIRLGWCRGNNLSNASLEYAVLNGANISRTKLDFANLDHAILKNVNANGAHFDSANLNLAIFEDCDLRHADFTDARMTITVFKRCDLRGAKINNNSKDTRFYECDLRGTGMKFHPIMTMNCRTGNIICDGWYDPYYRGISRYGRKAVYVLEDQRKFDSLADSSDAYFVRSLYRDGKISVEFHYYPRP